MSFPPIWEREVGHTVSHITTQPHRVHALRIQSSILQPSGPICPACNHRLERASLQTQLEVQIRACIGRYYQGWTVCDDATCGHRTRSMSVYGRRCVRPACRGVARFEYSDVELYNQLRYFAMLFDPDKASKAATGSAHFGTRFLVFSFST